MPPTVAVAAFIFGAILFLIALLGGGFELFGSKISGSVGTSGRAVAGILGVILMIVGLVNPFDRSSTVSPPSDGSLSAPTANRIVVGSQPTVTQMETTIPSATTEPLTSAPPTVIPTLPTEDPTSPIVIKPKSAISFQDEGTPSIDDTALVQEKDGFWAPSVTGSITQDYYATGIGDQYVDALSLQFNVGKLHYDNYRAILHVFVQQGSYGSVPIDGNATWNHYLAIPGKQNPDYQDSDPFSVPNTQTIDYSAGKWIEIELTPKFWSDEDIWVTLRLWNIRVDAVELIMVPK